MSVSPISWEGPADELLDVDQAAALLTVRPSTLRYWAREGRVPCIRLGLERRAGRGRYYARSPRRVLGYVPISFVYVLSSVAI